MKVRLVALIKKQLNLFLKGKTILPIEIKKHEYLKKIVVRIKTKFKEDERELYFPVELQFFYEYSNEPEYLEAYMAVQLDDEKETLDILTVHRRNLEIYNRRKAIDYANYYWNKRNPDFPAFEDNCTNYVSQCLLAGMMPMVFTGNLSSGWWYKQTNHYSYSWTVSQALLLYLLNKTTGIRAVRVDTAKELEPGDLIFISFKGQGINHASIVVDKDLSGEPLVNANTTDSYYRHWGYTNSPSFTPYTKHHFLKIVDDKE